MAPTRNFLIIGVISVLWLLGNCWPADATSNPESFHGWWDGLGAPSYVVSMSSDTLFRSDSATVSPSGRDALHSLARMLSTCPGVVKVIGYTDSVGSAQYNQELSVRRARSVAVQLSANGVSTSRLTVEGRGEDSPVASNGTGFGRALNRRVVIDVTTTSESSRCAQ